MIDIDKMIRACGVEVVPVRKTFKRPAPDVAELVLPPVTPQVRTPAAPPVEPVPASPAPPPRKLRAFREPYRP